MQKSLAVIIPAYNEAPRLGHVLDALIAFAGASRILVVDDGSQDATAIVANHYRALDPRIEVLQLPENRGKAAAMLAGAQTCTEPLLLFLDADLIGLIPEHLWSLAEPLWRNEADMSVALFEAGRVHTNMSHRLVPFISGQRCMRREDALQALEPVAAHRFAVETAITMYARRQRLRTRYVSWRKITHWTKEEKRGFVAGAWARCHMYGHIVNWIMRGLTAASLNFSYQTFAQSKGRLTHPGALPLMANRLTILLLIVLMAAYLFTGYENTQAYVGLRMQALENINLQAYSRLMVIAPHPDDEVLGAGGVIYDALQAGSEVMVLVVTNGDGSRTTAITSSRRPYPVAADYRRMGERRQLETLRAMSRLGLDEENVRFLCFPDRGLYQLWARQWNPEQPYRSPFTEQTGAYCTRAWRPGTPYAGASLLALLREAIAEFRPDAIIYPHPYDAHMDHAGLSAFVTLAIGLNAESDPSHRPDAFTYLVWQSGFPQPKGLHPQAVMLPPQCFLPGDWVWSYLTPAACTAKENAVRDYVTQYLTLGRFLDSFVRQQELFERPLVADVSWIVADAGGDDVSSSVELTSSELPFLFTVPDSGRIVTRLQPSAKIESVHAAAGPDTFWIGLKTREPIQRAVTFHVNIRSFEGDTLTERQVMYGNNRSKSVTEAQLRGKDLYLTIPRHVLGDGELFMIQIESYWRDLVMIDRSTWQLVRLAAPAWETQ